MFLFRNNKKLSLNYPQNPLLSGALALESTRLYLQIHEQIYLFDIFMNL